MCRTDRHSILAILMVRVTLKYEISEISEISVGNLDG